MKTIHALALCALLAALACFLGACQSTPGEIEGDEPDAKWVRTEIVCHSDRVLDEVTRLALSKQGYPGARGLEKDLSIESNWQNHLGAFKDQGYRLQAVIKYSALGEGRYELAARVRKQRNGSIVRPADLSYAEWKWVEDDENAAKVLVQLIKSYFLVGQG